MEPTAEHPGSGAAARLLAAWGRAMGSAHLSVAPGTWTHFVRAGSDAVVAVRIGSVGLSSAPQHLAGRVRRLPPEVLLDADRLASALPAGAVPLGTADLLTTGTATLGLARETDACRANPADLAPLRARVSPTEWDESGLGAADSVWAAGQPGDAVAAAGYSRWAADVAQFCVLTVPAARRRGNAKAAASLALTTALSEGLVPQWRSRRGNDASLRLGMSLGLAPVGIQAAVGIGLQELDRPPA